MTEVQKQYQYCNNGETAIPNVQVTIPSESGYTYVSYEATSGSYSPTNKVWNIPSASAETCYTLTITYSVSAEVLCEENCSKEATASPVNLNHGSTHTIRGIIPCTSLCTEGVTLIELVDQSDNISVSVEASSGNYTVTITDITYDWYFDYTIQCIHCDEVTEAFGPARVEGSTPQAPLLPYFMGEIRMFAGEDAPTGWALCDGTVLNTVDEPGLFSVIGNTYGGDGITTFALPDFRSKSPLGAGTGAGLSARALGDTGGAEEITLTVDQLAAHTHNVRIETNAELSNSPEAAGNILGEAGVNIYNNLPQEVGQNLGGVEEDPVGAGDPINIMNPFLTVNFIIAVKGFSPL